MGADQLIEVVSEVCYKLLPVVGFIVLIFVVMFMKHLIDVLKSVNVTLSKTNELVDECKGQMRKLDKPLATVNDLSESIDNVHESTKNAVNSAINVIVANLENVREWLASRKEKKEDIHTSCEVQEEHVSE